MKKIISAVFLCLGLASISSVRAETDIAAPADSTVVIANDTMLRSWLVFQKAMVATASGELVPAENPKAKEPEPDFCSELPPDDWHMPDFDDSGWERDQMPIEAGPETQAVMFSGPSSSLICSRLRFVVEDPAKAGNLVLSTKYVGGIVAYINGKEIARGHMPEGTIKADTFAERYPNDLYIQPDGKYVQMLRYKITDQETFDKRYRRLESITIPASLLHKGDNVLALEVHRAPVNELAAKSERVAHDTSMRRIPGLWSYAALTDVLLTAPSGAAVLPNVSRPKNPQVWQSMPWETVTAFSKGEGGSPTPVVIATPRNGVFSGRINISSDDAINNLSVAVSDFATAAGAKLPSSTVQVRYAAPGERTNSKQQEWRFNALYDQIPATIPTTNFKVPSRTYPSNYLRIKYTPQPGFTVPRNYTTSGAVAPIWLTARVPADATPGEYVATITVSAENLEPIKVPLKLLVSAWTMPAPRDFTITNFGQHSPDSLARRFKVPMWSDRHFELMGQSLALMAEINSRVALAELSLNFYHMNGNTDTMVRWIDDGKGGYTHDFTILDKYLDMVEKTIGKPSLLRLNCWGELRPGWGGSSKDSTEFWSKVNTGKKVTHLDPATGALDSFDQPVPGTEESYNFWKPVIVGILERVKARDWLDITAFGHNSYNSPAHPSIVTMAKKLWPEGVWAYTAHNGVLGANWKGLEKGDAMLCKYADGVWTRLTPKARGYRALLEPRPGYFCYTGRTDFNDASPLIVYRDIAEEEIMSGHDGVSDFGVDLVPVQEPSARRIEHVGSGRGTGGPESTTRAVLAAGPDGMLVTERFEMLREGVELGEAILYVERMLKDGKITGALADKANEILDARGEAFMKHWPSGQFQRNLALLALAGEIAEAVK